MMQQVIEVAGLDAAHDLLNVAYGSIRIQATGAGAGMRFTTTPVGPVRLDTVDYQMAFHADVEPLGAYTFGQLLAGRARYDTKREERAYLPGQVFLPAQPDDAFSAESDHVGFAFAVIDQASVDLVANGAAGRSDPVRFTGYDPISPDAAQAWIATYAHVRDLLDIPEAAAQPLVVGSAARMLVASALATFPNTALVAPTIEDRHDAHPLSLARAISFIEAHPDQDLSVADIAEAAHVSIRAVQLAFRRHLGTTPMAYLRRVRLDRAHAELRSGSPGDGGTVAAIAARWGYGRPSQFAAHYQAAYGELPSQTLRSAAPVAPSFVFTAPDFVNATSNKPEMLVVTSMGTSKETAADGDAEIAPVLDQLETLTRTLLGTTTVHAALQEIVAATTLIIPGADLVSVTVRAPDGTSASAVETDEVATELDQVQYDAGEGPALDVARLGGPRYVTSTDLGTEIRWPGFATVASGHGYRTIIAARLLPSSGPAGISGALNIYSRNRDGFTRSDRHSGLLLATHGSLALAHAHTSELADLRGANLRRAIETRDIIGQAKGILMNRRGISADAAFDLLRRTSQDLNIKLVDVARALTTSHNNLDQT